MKLYLIRYGTYYECTQVSEHVYSTHMGHIHTHNDYSPHIFQVFTNQWDALRFQYAYHHSMLVNHRMFYRGIEDSHYRLPYSLYYIKRHLIAQFPEDFL
jgi:hypothetical protein